jgi:hypothetical protein
LNLAHDTGFEPMTLQVSTLHTLPAELIMDEPIISTSDELVNIPIPFILVGLSCYFAHNDKFK